MKKRYKTLLKCFLGLLVGLIIIILLNFIPTLNLKTKDMIIIEKDHFIIYYEKNDKNAATDISNRLGKGYNLVSNSIKISPDYKTDVYIYKNLDEFHMKKYGFWGRFFGPEWYIGDNIKNKVIIVSPNSPGKQHNYDEVADAALHEYIHTLMWSINPKVSKFLNEGMAGYISGNAKPVHKITSAPSYEDTKVTDPVTFGNHGMYSFSYTYIEYLDKTYGMEKVLELVKDNNYEQTFEKTEKEIFDEWIKFLNSNYLN
ncbi:hypothetical protein DVW05_09640 [Clostridium botulinum]|uniref:hypothetical protein n=1 Tax=Clostridium sp. ZBS18 TaxID=2949967 RepID=UPI001DDBD27D|nr:hypothetical protein [Clostridium sp. ZBS18]MBN1055604.1 hypothetical protein [Clostridium botulinum]